MLAIFLCAALLLHAFGRASTPEHRAGFPVLAPGDSVVMDHARYRVVLGPVIDTDGGVYNQVHVHQKTAVGRNFTLEGTLLSVEGVVGNALVISDGMHLVRPLRVYDLQTGELILETERDKADVDMVFEDATHFSYYTEVSDAPTASWNGAEWVVHGAMPKGLDKKQLDILTKKLETQGENLYEGYSLELFQRVRIDLDARKEILLAEYDWAFMDRP